MYLYLLLNSFSITSGSEVVVIRSNAHVFTVSPPSFSSRRAPSRLSIFPFLSLFFY
jgi:hypothetical protein